MDKQSLERSIKLHRMIAEGLKAQFRRLWGRELATDEIDTVESYALCCSLMRFEMLERRLSEATSREQADQDYAFVQSEVSSHRPCILLEFQEFQDRQLTHGPLPRRSLPSPSSFSNLLAWEVALLKSLS